ncbi:phage portal protein, partial [Xenorhabdus bovienii]|nr:phage portal protein [Xenorhabdus bovienii]
GWMSRNDVRRLENLPPIDGGDIHTVQLNLTPIEQLGKAGNGTESEKLRAQTADGLFPEKDALIRNTTQNLSPPHSEE